MKKYSISHLDKLEEIEVTRLTDKGFYSIHPYRNKEERTMNGNRYFDTKEEAKQGKINERQADVDNAKRRLEYAENQLWKAQNIEI